MFISLNLLKFQKIGYKENNNSNKKYAEGI